MAFGIMTFGIMTFGIMTFGKITFGIMTFIIMTIGIVTDKVHVILHVCSVECKNVTILLNVVILSVLMLTVVAPNKKLKYIIQFEIKRQKHLILA